jgi:hypothetical protein
VSPIQPAERSLHVARAVTIAAEPVINALAISLGLGRDSPAEISNT